MTTGVRMMADKATLGGIPASICLRYRFFQSGLNLDTTSTDIKKSLAHLRASDCLAFSSSCSVMPILPIGGPQDASLL